MKIVDPITLIKKKVFLLSLPNYVWRLIVFAPVLNFDQVHGHTKIMNLYFVLIYM